MSKKSPLRVELTPEAFKIVEAEAYLTGKTMKEIASDILMSGCSEEASKIIFVKENISGVPLNKDDISILKKTTGVRKDG